MSLRTIVESWKAISVGVQWTAPDEADGYSRIYVPLDVDDITEAGLILSGGTYSRHPDRHVTFELAITGVEGVRRIRLIRLDWKSLTGGHSNPRGCLGEWSGRRVPVTHLHSFDLNWVEAEGRMRRGKLPCARPVERELQTFEDVRDFVGSHFKINNMNIVPRPDWVYGLFVDEFTK
jgi:hypothetical protein